ncbi:ornithine carbamoyltransferase [Ruminococcaceae bacterium OttesenSCG-928-A16]|nr:ornithine carbamoyltransferase [Ruminococcaceae bacterium OttesenSCG-928-A16]
MKHLLKLSDWTGEEIIATLDLADKLKAEQKQGIPHPALKGKSIALVFSKASTRTRCSFDVGVYQLGAHSVTLSSAESQIGRGEPIEDTARVLGRYFDGIMIRTYKQSDVEELAKYSGVPVINGLTDDAHPCQVLADLQTIREYKGKLAGLKMAYIGDGNNMANSLIAGALLTGMQISVACPVGYQPAPAVLEYAAKFSGFTLTDDPKTAAAGADVLITDVWASMGQEQEAEARKKAFAGYQINNDLLALANPGCMVQHCLPAHRGEEIAADVLEAHANEIFDEAENRLHAQKAVMVKLMG